MSGACESCGHDVCVCAPADARLRQLAEETTEELGIVKYHWEREATTKTILAALRKAVNNE